MNFRLLLAQVLLLLLGLVGIAAAEPSMALDHGLKVLIALVITFVVAQIPPRWLMRAGLPIWGLSLVLLALVLFVGESASHSTGTKRWLDLGFVRFQPSELAKLGLVLQLASFFSRRGVNNKLISATGMMLLTTIFILIEPDLGTAVMTFMLGVVVMYAAGVRFTNIALLLLSLGLISLPMASIYLENHPYILERIFGYTQRAEVLNMGLDQIGKAHRDLSNGGIWGLGPDAPRYYNFAWETDLIISSIGFSLGLMGVLTVIYAYWLIVHTSLGIAQRASRVRPMSRMVHGAAILAVGCMFLIVGQAAINLGVAAGILPVTGITLPFVSYGFSSMLIMSIAIGAIHAAEKEVRRAEAQAKAEANAAGQPQVVRVQAPAVQPQRRQQAEEGRPTV